MKITYRFSHNVRQIRDFEIDVGRPPRVAKGRARWTELATHQCKNCPLSAAQVTHCPAAVDLEEVVEAFNDVMSYEAVVVIVDTPERHVIKDCDAQDALTPLLGLIMANSACPILGRMRGLAATHLPFQNLEETLFRFIGAHYLGQLIAQRNGTTPDWSLDNLHALFDDLMIVNQAFKARLHSGTEQDAAINAVSALAMHTLGAQLSVDDYLDDMARYALPAKYD